MIIVLHHSNFYEWEPCDEPATEEEKTGPNCKQDMSGQWLSKVQKESPGGSTHTTIAINESQIARLQAHFVRKGQAWPRTREEVACYILATETLKEHTAPEHITAVQAHDEHAVVDGAPHADHANPPVKAEIERFFKVKAAPAVAEVKP